MDENDLLPQIHDLGVLEHQALQRIFDGPGTSTRSTQSTQENRAPRSAACFIDANFSYVESRKKIPMEVKARDMRVYSAKGGEDKARLKTSILLGR